MAHYGGAHLDHFQRTLIDTASVSVIHLDGGIPRVLLVNDTGGLDRFAPRPRGASATAKAKTKTEPASRRNLRG